MLRPPLVSSWKMTFGIIYMVVEKGIKRQPNYEKWVIQETTLLPNHSKSHPKIRPEIFQNGNRSERKMVAELL